MNIQAIMRQAQNMQAEIEKTKKEIESLNFEEKNGFVKVIVTGKKEIVDIQIDISSLDKDDIDALQDMIMVATNKCMQRIDKLTEEKLGKFANIPGIF